MKNDNELVGPRFFPRYLIVVVVPKSPKDWLAQGPKALTLRHCGYWASLTNEPASTNDKSVTVHIPRANVFSVEALRQLLGLGATK